MRLSDDRPTCPFCGAAWSERMIATFMASSRPCRCCGDAAAAAERPAPTEDLLCAACGRAIYRTPHAAQAVRAIT